MLFIYSILQAVSPPKELICIYLYILPYPGGMWVCGAKAWTQTRKELARIFSATRHDGSVVPFHKRVLVNKVYEREVSLYVTVAGSLFIPWFGFYCYVYAD